MTFNIREGLTLLDNGREGGRSSAQTRMSKRDRWAKILIILVIAQLYLMSQKTRPFKMELSPHTFRLSKSILPIEIPWDYKSPLVH